MPIIICQYIFHKFNNLQCKIIIQFKEVEPLQQCKIFQEMQARGANMLNEI